MESMQDAVLQQPTTRDLPGWDVVVGGEKRVRTTAELVNELFRTRRRPDGQEYTNSDVSRALSGELSPAYLSKMRKGRIPNPGRNALLLLSRFFRVPPAYFFPELADLFADTTPIKSVEFDTQLGTAGLAHGAKKYLEALIESLGRPE